jgi:hypothetical protein
MVNVRWKAEIGRGGYASKGEERGNSYEADYRALSALQEFAGERRLGIIVSHHDRKMRADDILPADEQGACSHREAIILMVSIRCLLWVAKRSKRASSGNSL